MYTAMVSTRLSSGEPLQIGVVEPAGDTAWAPRVLATLAHKSAVNRLHLEGAFRGDLDDLETLFYVGTVANEIVTVAMLAGGHGAAVYGHVYTQPVWRRRGAASTLHRVLGDDWRRRGYRVVTLGTDATGHARRLYEGIVGFGPLVAGRGDMIWRDGPEFGDVGPLPSAAAGVLRWGDWGWVSAACCAPVQPEEELPRSVLFRARSVHCVGWPFIVAMTGGGGGQMAPAEVPVLRRGEAVVGWASVLPDAAQVLGAAALELYLQPGARTEAAADALLSALRWPKGMVVHVCTATQDYRSAAMIRHGFVRRKILPGWWDLGRGREDAALWSRAPRR